MKNSTMRKQQGPARMLMGAVNTDGRNIPEHSILPHDRGSGKGWWLWGGPRRTPPTSNVISRRFFGICITPVSPSSPDTQTQGLEVMMVLLSFLVGMTTTL